MFADLKWRVESIDIDPLSNATKKMNIMDFDPERHLKVVPDFAWMSPDCSTYSHAAGRHHRNPKRGELETSRKAGEHNMYLTKITQFLRWGLPKHRHMIFVIENPLGYLKDMPLMKKLVKELRLYEVTVNYCAFGKDVKKPTNLWTNDRRLSELLARFTCMCTQPHNGSVQKETDREHSCIPEALAYFVAKYVDSKFWLEGIQDEPSAIPWTYS